MGSRVDPWASPPRKKVFFFMGGGGPFSSCGDLFANFLLP